MNLKSQLVLLFAGAMLLTACGSTETAPADTATTAAVSETATVTEETTAPDPAFDGYTEPDAVDYNGDDFVFWYNGGEWEPNQDVDAAELNGEALNDAVFSRNKAIEDKYNIHIVSEYSDNITSQVTKSVQAGDNAVDVVLDHHCSVFKLALKGCYYNLRELPNVCFDRAWWDSTILEDTEILGRNYFAISSMNIHAYGATPVVVFNKKVASDYDLEDFYSVVADGKWTMDYMMSVAKGILQDVNGDGTYTLDDMYGLIANNFSVDCFIGGSGYRFVTVGDDGLLTSNLQSEQLVTIYNKILEATSLENGAYLTDRYLGSHCDTEIEQVFEENRALFWVTNLKGVQRRRSMTGDFGVLPMPKITEEQDKYYAHMQSGVGDSIAVPVTCPDPDKVGRILEDFASYSYRDVIPAFYDITIAGKSMRDDGSVQTLDILLNNYYYDVGTSTNITYDLRTPITKGNSDVVSFVTKKEKGFEKSLDKINQFFTEAE